MSERRTGVKEADTGREDERTPRTCSRGKSAGGGRAVRTVRVEAKVVAVNGEVGVAANVCGVARDAGVVRAEHCYMGIDEAPWRAASDCCSQLLGIREVASWWCSSRSSSARRGGRRRSSDKGGRR